MSSTIPPHGDDDVEKAIELRGITKVYPEGRSKANNNISLDLHPGEILCLAGENGAGKSTLMKILFGLTTPTQGEIWVRGNKARINSPLDAYRLGIGMVHQHFMLFPEFTVAQNVVMGIEPRKWGILYDASRATRQVEKVIQQHNFSINASSLVSSLTVGQMQQVEIVKLLYRNVDVFILDEPTAVLTDQEITSLFATLQSLANSGKSLILITHKLHEIKRIAHRVAIMRKGELLGVFNAEEIDEYELSRLMVGRGIELESNARPALPEGSEAVLTFDNVTVKRRGQERPLLDRVSFRVHRGEILGFAGVGGNGLGVLEAVLGGFLPIHSGSIYHFNRDISTQKTFELRHQGLAYVPADRLIYGSAPAAEVGENMIINRRHAFAPGGIFNASAVKAFTQDLLNRYSISGNSTQRLGSLSGGNIQKVILSREIDQWSDYIVFSEPTRGLDVASSEYVYQQMADLRDRGAAVILISSNLDEILANANRIIVFYRGAIAAVLPAAIPAEVPTAIAAEIPAEIPAGLSAQTPTEMSNDSSGIGSLMRDTAWQRDIKEKIGAYMLGLDKDYGR